MEQKTILEELLEESSANHEKHKKIGRAKLCASREEWEEAEAIYAEVLEEYPEDEEALKGRLMLSRNMEEEQRRDEKIRRDEEKKSSRKASGKRSIALVLVVVLIVCAAAAALLGVRNHRNKIDGLHSETKAPVQRVCIAEYQKTDAL